MKVAYILNSPNAANYKVGEMILPQLEADNHGVDVVGIFFFDDNTMLLQKGNPNCLLYTSPSPRDLSTSRMPSSA